jgi:hypothetical protein
MVNAPERSTVMTLGRVAVRDKPFIVSEVNHPYPNEFASEGIPILAAYGAFQDWDGIFWYSFSHSEPSTWKPSPPGFFDIRQDPGKMAQTAAAALLFERGDILPARQTVNRSYSPAQVAAGLRLAAREGPFFTPGFPPLLPLVHGTRVAGFELEAQYPTLPVGEKLLSDTGELTWFVQPPGQGLVVVDSPRTQSVIGYVQHHTPKTRNLLVEPGTPFCAVSLQSLDNNPIGKAPRLLLTAVARVSNQGMVWNEKRTTTTETGTAPVLIEPVTGSLTLRNLAPARAVRLQALDGGGLPLGQPFNATGTPEAWRTVLGAPATVWYLVHVIR